MKPSPWFPISVQPVRNGQYVVRDSTTGARSMWHWYGVPGGDGDWSVQEAFYIPRLGTYRVTSVAPTLEWRGLTDEIWTTRTGEELPIFLIDGEHAKNIVRMILRKQRHMREEIAKTDYLFRAKPKFDINWWKEGK